MLNVLLIVLCNIAISLGSSSFWKTGARGAQGRARARQVTDDRRCVFSLGGAEQQAQTLQQQRKMNC